MAQSSGRLQHLRMQLASLCDIHTKNDEDYQRQIVQIEQEQAKSRQEIEQLCVLKGQQEMKRNDEYSQKKGDLEAKITAERDAKVAEVLQDYNEIFTRTITDMVGSLSSQKAQDEEIMRVAYEAFNSEAEISTAQIQALQATKCGQKARDDKELLILQQEIQAEEENQRRCEEIQNRRETIQEKKQQIEKMIQDTEEEEQILRGLQQEKIVDYNDMTTYGQDIGAESDSDEQSQGDSFERPQGASLLSSTTHSQTQDAVQSQHQTTSDHIHKGLNINTYTNPRISLSKELGQQFEDEKKLLSLMNEAMSCHGQLVMTSNQGQSYLHYLQSRLSSSYQCHEIEKRHWRRLFSEFCRRHEIDVAYVSMSPFAELDDGAWADLASSASAGSLWVSLFEIFEPYLGKHAGVVIAAYSGDSSDVENLDGSAKEAFLSEIRSRCQAILRAFHPAVPIFEEFLKVIAPEDNLYPLATPSWSSSGSCNPMSEPDEHWPDDVTSKSVSLHTSNSEDSETQNELLRVDLEAEKVKMDTRWKIVDGEYTAPWWMKGVPVEKISEGGSYWDKQWTKSRDLGGSSASYIDSKDCPVHPNQIVSKECIANGAKTNGLLNINYIGSLKAIISTLMGWGFTDIEAFQWFRLRLGLQLEEHTKLYPDRSLGLRSKICRFSKTDKKYHQIKQEVESGNHLKMFGKPAGSLTPKLSRQHSKGAKRQHSPGSPPPASAHKLPEAASKKVRHVSGAPPGGGKWFDETGVETISPISGSDDRDDEHESVSEHTNQTDICNKIILGSDRELPHNQGIVIFDLALLESNQSRITLSYIRFQIHLDMGAKILIPVFEVLGANDVDLPPEWQSCLDLTIQLDKVTALRLGSHYTDDRIVWIEHRHPARHSSTYQEPQMKRSTVKLVFQKVEDAMYFIRTISPAVPRRCLPELAYEIVQ